MNNEKLIHQFLGVASVVGLFFAAWQIGKLVKEYSKPQKKSNFSGDNELKTIEFTITNNTNQTQVEYLFDSRSRQDNPNVTVDGNLQEFNQELSNTPKLVKKIQFRSISNAPTVLSASPTKNYKQAEAPLQLVCKTADGKETINSYRPLMSEMQVQKGITSLIMNDYLLDGECFMKYTMYPNSSMTMIVYYIEKPLSELLKNKKQNSKLLTLNS